MVAEFPPVGRGASFGRVDLESVMTSEEAARDEIDQVLLHVDRTIQRMERSISTVSALEWADPELRALRAAHKQLLATRKILTDGSLRTPQQRLL